MSTHSLTDDQREQILTEEINRRTRDGRTEFLAAKPGKAYFAINGGVNKWWPVRLAMDIGWVLAAIIIGFALFPLLGIVALFAAPWWARRCAPAMLVVTVGERGNLTVDTLIWGHAYKIEQQLANETRSQS